VSATLAMLRGAFVLACALLAIAVAAQRAHAGLKPEAPPHSHGSNSLRPVPGPGASSGKSSSAKSSSTSAPSSGSPASSYAPAVRRAAVTTAFVSGAYVHPAVPAAPPARHKPHPPAQGGGRLVGLRDAAGLDELRAVASSGGSALLLAAGFALVLLVIAEASFLGLAGSRFGVSGPRRASGRRSQEEPYPISRIQLRG
jgi:hypothetical protein